MIEGKDLEYLCTQMGINIKDISIKVCNTDQENLLIKSNHSKNMDCGKKVKIHTGLTNLK